MWIIQEPKKVALWNKRHFEEKNGECAACLKYFVLIFDEKKYIKCNVWRVAVRPSYIWDARFLKVKPIGTYSNSKKIHQKSTLSTVRSLFLIAITLIFRSKSGLQLSSTVYYFTRSDFLNMIEPHSSVFAGNVTATNHMYKENVSL